MTFRVDITQGFINFIESFHQQAHRLADLTPHDLDIVPAGHGACGWDHAHLPRVIADRLSLALTRNEVTQYFEKFVRNLFEAKCLVGGMFCFLLKQSKVRGTKRVVSLCQHSAEQARRRSAQFF